MHALKSLKKRGAEIAEGYPVAPKKPGEKIPDAFAWTGTRSLFEGQGFALVGSPTASKLRVRKKPALSNP